MASRRSREKSSKRNFPFACFHLVFWKNASGTGCDTTAPHVQEQFQPINRTRCQSVSGLAMSSTKRGWDWCPLIFLHCFEDKKQIRVKSHCILDYKPVAHLNQSHCILPSLTMARKSDPVIAKIITANPTQSDRAEVVEDICEDLVTGAGGCGCRMGRLVGGSWVEDFSVVLFKYRGSTGAFL